MVWSLDLDDFSGDYCNQGPYPLINAMKRVTDEQTDIPAVTPTPAPATPKPDTDDPGKDITKEGFICNSLHFGWLLRQLSFDSRLISAGMLSSQSFPFAK